MADVLLSDLAYIVVHMLISSSNLGSKAWAASPVVFS